MAGNLIAHRTLTNIQQHCVHGGIYALDERGVLRPQPIGAMRQAFLRLPFYREVPEDTQHAVVTAHEAASTLANVLSALPTPDVVGPTEAMGAAAEPPPVEPELTEEDIEKLFGPEAASADPNDMSQRELVDAGIAAGLDKKTAWSMPLPALRQFLAETTRAKTRPQPVIDSDNPAI